jgi:3D (Asp-Asp-Asp) domain-containing protein
VEHHAAVESAERFDTINGPRHPTDAAGQAAAQVETRDQTAQSTITASNSDINTTQPAAITWLPADYENDFVVTCYVISDENDYLSTQSITNVCGLPPLNSYRSGFIRDVRMQGSGRALNGDIIHYAGHQCYEILPCATTATGACAVEGTTIAVDPGVIPLRSSVNVATLGNRLAQDTGGGINGYHIDNFRGFDRPGCRAFGRQRSNIRFLNY